MRYIKFVLLALLTQTVFALDIAQTKYGRLEIKSTGEYEKELFLGSKIIFKPDGGYLNIGKVFHIGNNEIALISHEDGGSGTMPSYFFVKLTPNSQPMFTKEFMAQESEIKPIQKGDQITIDLGYNEGAHEVLTYQNGKQSIDKIM